MNTYTEKDEALRTQEYFARKFFREEEYQDVESGGYSYFVDEQGHITSHGAAGKRMITTREEFADNMLRDADPADLPNLGLHLNK